MLKQADLQALLKPGEGPHISLLLPTERRFPASQQNLIRFRNLLRQAEALLEKESTFNLPVEQRDALLAPLHALIEDPTVWAHPQESLLVYRAADQLRYFWLPLTTMEQAVVANSFHVKPLLRALQGAQRYHVLALHADRIRLLEGDRTQLHEVELAAPVPRTLEQALGTEVDDPDADSFSYDAGPSVNGEGGRRAGGARSGSNAQAIEKDMERFFRAVDRELARHHSQPSGLPLILASLSQYHEPFRRVSTNALLVEQTIDINPDALPLDELRQRAWYALQPRFEEKINELLDRYGAAHGVQRADDRLQDVAIAAVTGRVAVLLIEEGRQVLGQLDPQSGAFLPLSPNEPQADDLLDDLAEQVLTLGGEVYVLSKSKMPSTTGLAAIYRY